mmetsp:Transcript_8042/g.8879  ORF Transcript_8042/g.8879 Transcript_8042/m.8879 type:complete len:229 (+) Transcript_8042:450-1136(+)
MTVDTFPPSLFRFGCALLIVGAFFRQILFRDCNAICFSIEARMSTGNSRSTFKSTSLASTTPIELLLVSWWGDNLFIVTATFFCDRFVFLFVTKLLFFCVETCGSVLNTVSAQFPPSFLPLASCIAVKGFPMFIFVAFIPFFWRNPVIIEAWFGIASNSEAINPRDVIFNTPTPPSSFWTVAKPNRVSTRSYASFASPSCPCSHLDILPALLATLFLPPATLTSIPLR